MTPEFESKVIALLERIAERLDNPREPTRLVRLIGRAAGPGPVRLGVSEAIERIKSNTAVFETDGAR